MKISLVGNGCFGAGKILSVNGPEGVKIILSFRELAFKTGLAGAGNPPSRSQVSGKMVPSPDDEKSCS